MIGNDARFGESADLQVINPYRIIVKDGTLLVGRKSTDESQNHVSPSMIRFDSEQTYRPVGAEEDAVRAEEREGFLEISAQRGLVDFRIQYLVDHAGNLDAEDVLTLGKFGHAGSPSGIDLAIPDFRLGDVVDDDAEIGLAIHQLDRHRKLALEKQ